MKRHGSERRRFSLFAGGLSGCVDDKADRYVHYLPAPPEGVMVRGCDGYPLGTVRVDMDGGKPGMCNPVKTGCNETGGPGCGEGYFATGKIKRN